MINGHVGNCGYPWFVYVTNDCGIDETGEAAGDAKFMNNYARHNRNSNYISPGNEK